MSEGLPRRTDTAFVVFHDSLEPRWWHGFCVDGFKHCWVMVPQYWPDRGVSSFKTTLKIEAGHGHLDVQHWRDTPETIARQFLDDEETVSTVIAVRYEVPSRQPIAFKGLITCVSIVKYALGFRAWHVWTPRELCHYLIAHRGGIVLERKKWADCSAAAGAAETRHC